MSRYHNRIDRRTNENYYGISLEVERNQERRLVPADPIADPMIFVDREIPSHFVWNDILAEKIPRDYQLKAFIRGLLEDLIIVMPTGAGKTLVASMILHRMGILNTSKMGLIIVDKVPLVFQHQHNVQKDTDLIGLPLCGENLTNRRWLKVKQRSVDFLVITAGALLCKIEKGFRLECFHTIIFDECHHATGDHVYSRVLESVNAISIRPRIIGLTASAVPAKTPMEAEKNLNDLMKRFGKLVDG